MRQTRISKAMQQRRRSLAGRNASGTCYTLYTKDCCDKVFPEHSTPEALTTNLGSFLLGRLASGLKLDDSLQLLNMQQARYVSCCTAGNHQSRLFSASYSKSLPCFIPRIGASGLCNSWLALHLSWFALSSTHSFQRSSLRNLWLALHLTGLHFLVPPHYAT